MFPVRCANYVTYSPAEGQLPQLSLIVPLLSKFLPESVIRSLCRLYPNADLRDLLGISDTMAQRSRDIIAEKKAALNKGDEELVHRVGEGKDLMGIIRESYRIDSVRVQPTHYSQGE